MQQVQTSSGHVHLFDLRCKRRQLGGVYKFKSTQISQLLHHPGVAMSSGGLGRLLITKKVSTRGEINKERHIYKKKQDSPCRNS
jgi:hypothetical protein